MNQNLIRVIEVVGKEKGIGKDILISAVEAAVVSACKRNFPHDVTLKSHMDPETGEIKVFQVKKVVETVANPDQEISLTEAKKIDKDTAIDSSIEFPVVAEYTGRIPAQIAKQVIMQRVREAERENVYAEYKGREGELVNGIVTRVERRNIYADLGASAEAILPYNEQVPRESYRRGDRIRALLLEVDPSAKGPMLILSRANPQLVTRLFEIEVPEIRERILEIKGTVREAGKRTKIAVYSHDGNVDPVGTCVGMRGSRVQAIVRELDGEKIDIIKWSADLKTFISNALSPAEIKKITVEENGAVEVLVADDQLSLAIGKKGQNARLGAKLTGCNIDIKSSADKEKEKFEEEKKKYEAVLASLDGVGDKTAGLLVENGFLRVEDLMQATVEDLVAIEGIGKKKAEKILESAKEETEKKAEEKADK
jgi:N utilization substance protein A